ncbi:MAG: GNAT family N-acetyltransferase [Sphaerobacteraceae bacterium]|nr:MAG: GNAT family N-acetyltransferase [Sphaerobacteraceae bacterium]
MTVDTNALTIRAASTEDTWAVRKLFKGLHDFNASLDPRFSLAENWEQYLDEHLKREWNGARSLTLIAWEGERPIGLLMLAGYSDSPLFQYRHWAEILALFIDPEVRGGMLALRFVRMAKSWAKDHGYDRIQLYVTATNERAKRFYQKCKFEPVQEIWRLELGDGVPDFVFDEDDGDYGPDNDPLTPKPHNVGEDD